MKPNELFELITVTAFNESGLDVGWQLHESKDTVYLLFRESRTRQNWKTNLDYPIKPYKKQESLLLIHCGFAKAYKSCNDEIMEAFISLVNKNPNKKIMIIGWSFGGAMSLLAAEDFHFRTNKKANVTTFGGPKVAFGRKTRDYIRNCIDEMHLYAHRSDIITKMPPFYTKVGRDKVGKFSLIGLFQPNKYHGSYGDKSLY